MLSRRKLFGFLAAAPVVGTAVAKAATADRARFTMHVDKGALEPQLRHSALGANLGSCEAGTITVNNQTPHGVTISTRDGRCHIAYGKVVIRD